MVIELLSVGTELLLGDILNTNVQYLSRELAIYGFDIFHSSVVGDNEERIMDALKLALSRADMVITTGGLGATSDDITKDVVIKLVNRPQFIDVETKKVLEKRNLSKKIVQTNEKAYMFPEGSEVMINNHGIASGAWVPYNNKIIVFFPGPPNEMIPMFEESFIPLLLSKSDSVIESLSVKIGLLPEYEMYKKFEGPIKESINPTFAPYAKPDGSIIRITAKGKTKEETEKLLEKGFDQLRDVFGEYIIEAGDREKNQVLIDILKERKETVSCAESLTGGLLSSRLIEVAGASEVLKESYVTYSNEAKVKVLGVSDAVIREKTAVSEEICGEMLAGLKKNTNSNLQIATTGYAGPTGENVGLVYIGIRYNDNSEIHECKFTGDRDYIRRKTVNLAIDYSIMKMRREQHG